MKYTIEGFSQEKAIKLGLDVKDLVFLRWIVDFYHSGKMEILFVDGESYFWVRYERVLEELPILNIRDKVALGRRLKVMVKKGVLKFQCAQGNRTYYKFNAETLHQLLSSNRFINTLTSKSKGCLLQKAKGACSDSQAYIDSSISDSSIIDRKKHVDKKTEEETVWPFSSQFLITRKSFFESLKKTYSYIDLGLEFRKMEGWLLANPARRQRYRNWEKFIVNWLNRIDKPLPLPKRRTTEYPNKGKQPDPIERAKVASLIHSTVAKMQEKK